MFSFFAAWFFCRKSDLALTGGARIFLPQLSCCRPTFEAAFCRPLWVFTRLTALLFIMPWFGFVIVKIKFDLPLAWTAQLRRNCGFAVVARRAFPIPLTASAILCLWLTAVLTRTSLVAAIGGFFRPSRRAPTFFMLIIIIFWAPRFSRPWLLWVVIISIAAIFMTYWPLFSNTLTPTATLTATMPRLIICAAFFRRFSWSFMVFFFTTAGMSWACMWTSSFYIYNQNVFVNSLFLITFIFWNNKNNIRKFLYNKVFISII